MRGRNRVLLSLFCTLLLGGLVLGCGARRPKMIVLFDVDPGSQQGILLPVDLIWTTELNKKEILAIAPEDWWYSSYRKGLVEPDLKTLALREGIPKEISLEGPKGADTLIIYADIAGVIEESLQRIVISPRVTGKRATIKVRKSGLTLVANR